MVDACLAAGVHYLDITGEIAVFESILARGAEAREAGVVLLPGIGFDVVPTDCLARELKERLPDATHLDLAFVAEGGGWSRGTLATMIESLPHAGAMRRNGRIVPLPLAAESMEIELPVGRRTVMSIAWGDVATAFHTTGIPNIRTFTGVPEREVHLLRKVRPLLPLAGWKPVKRLLQLWVRRTVTGPTADQRRRARTWIWGTARNAARRGRDAPLLDRRRLRPHGAHRDRRGAARRGRRRAAGAHGRRHAPSARSSSPSSARNSPRRSPPSAGAAPASGA